ncbi:MAG: imidazoleglycerol-phosphate dehydratase HisB [Bacillaceae bacterium]
MRTASINRKTRETDIYAEINLDGNGIADIETGIGFLDHMLTLFTFHSGFDVLVRCEGDLEVDDHHTVEDVAIVLGQTLSRALGEKMGIHRYGFSYIPMDETLARVVVDLSGRPAFIYDAKVERERVGSMDTQNVKEFFKSFANEAKMNLHMEVLYGDNDHHKVEALFKAWGRALKAAVEIVSDTIPSTKGIL